ncbi:ABC transporter ATP-binding protein [Psychrobacter sp. I-STPA6b]|uniref:iron ABC transporter ATP-binding protein n=1 Tax=Psychrobacter sp. I-STPA6b TaxID=2585718 RepID=UPI001D0C3362|nr:ATP-binding cassette domain-containing protein [Psychrobacter sp. I-STPA6b]
MIKIENLHYHIGNTPILKDINLELADNQLIALIGANGAGKSTLFAMMARLLPFEQGEIHIGGHDIRHERGKTLAKVVSMLSQDNHLQGRLRVKELLTFGRYPYHQGRPSNEDMAIIDKVMADFELTDLAQRFLSTLSGGQRQRALIAMVVCQDTPYILLDEPLNNLDMYHTSQMMRQFRRLVDDQGKTLVVVLHDINHATQYADNIVMMKSGQVYATGTPSELITVEHIKQLYGVDVAILHHAGRPIIVDDVSAG